MTTLTDCSVDTYPQTTPKANNMKRYEEKSSKRGLQKIKGKGKEINSANIDSGIK